MIIVLKVLAGIGAILCVVLYKYEKKLQAERSLKRLDENERENKE